MAKSNKITVQNIEIGVKTYNDQDYICLTHIASGKDGDDHIRNWMRNRNTIEYLGVWESLNNANFKGVEFDTFKKQSGLNSFNMTPRKWIDATDAVGIVSSSGKYGGTYAHKDIAFNFAMWISPVFQLYVIKEYQRLKEIENNEYGIEWNVKRILSKANYQIHTDAVKNYIVPKAKFSQAKEWLLYADEADLLNIALFGCTAKEWKEVNPARALQGENIRFMASINELTILSNIESLNATLIKNGFDKKQRLKILVDTVKDQKSTLDRMDILKSIKKTSDTTYIDQKKASGIGIVDKTEKKSVGFNPKS